MSALITLASPTRRPMGAFWPLTVGAAVVVNKSDDMIFPETTW